MNDFYNNVPWDLIAKVLSGEADATLIKDLNDWAIETPKNKALLVEIEDLWKNSANYQIAITESQNLDLDSAWSKIHTTVEQNTSPLKLEKSPSFMKRYGTRVAASAAAFVLLTLTAYWAMPYLTGANLPQVETTWLAVSNEMNQPKTIQMPDGSSIVLNTGTSLRYPDHFEPRLVELTGEAFFEVVPDTKRPFEVRFGADNSVKVLGTSFNIRAYEEEEEVTVAVNTGKVAFKASKLDKITLIANESISYNAKNNKLLKANDPNATAWRTKTLTFNNSELEYVLRVLDNHFDTKFEVDNPNILNCRFKGDFENEPLENIIQAISFSLELDIKANKNVYYISGQGCEVN